MFHTKFTQNILFVAITEITENLELKTEDRPTQSSNTVFPGIEGAALNFFFTWNCVYN